MNMTSRMRWIAVTGLVLSGFILGCGSGGFNAPTGTVSGKVTINGKPLTDATIVFMGEGNGETGMAPLQADGTYTLKYGAGFSVPAGDYRVALTSTPPNAPPPDPAALMANPEKYKPNESIPEKYRDATTSGLIAVVKPGSNSNVDFELK